MKRAIRLLLLLCLVVAGVSSAQRLDSPLRLVVPSPPGGGQDYAARILADALKSQIGAPVIVENRSGGEGTIAARSVLAAPTTENVVLLGNPTMMALATVLSPGIPYDPERDFVPLSQIRSYMYAVAVRPDMPTADISGLIAWLKANPGRANFGLPSLGGLPHLFALVLADASGVSPQMIGYRGSAPLQIDLLGGNIPTAIDVLDVMVQQHSAGKLRVLAVSGSHRSTNLPDVPTLKEKGIDAVGEGWSVIFAPATMSPEKVRLLSRAIQDVMALTEVQARFRAANLDPVVSSREQTERMLTEYRARWEPIARAAKLQQ